MISTTAGFKLGVLFLTRAFPPCRPPSNSLLGCGTEIIGVFQTVPNLYKPCPAITIRSCRAPTISWAGSSQKVVGQPIRSLYDQRAINRDWIIHQKNRPQQQPTRTAITTITITAILPAELSSHSYYARHSVVHPHLTSPKAQAHDKSTLPTSRGLFYSVHFRLLLGVTHAPHTCPTQRELVEEQRAAGAPYRQAPGLNLPVNSSVEPQMSLSNVGPPPCHANALMQWRHFNFFDSRTLTSDADKKTDIFKVLPQIPLRRKLRMRMRTLPVYARRLATSSSGTPRARSVSCPRAGMSSCPSLPMNEVVSLT
jgi:hypothetical protein